MPGLSAAEGWAGARVTYRAEALWTVYSPVCYDDG